MGTADPLTESGVCHFSFCPINVPPLRLQKRLSPPSVTITARGRNGCTLCCPCSTPMCHRECRAGPATQPACTQTPSYSSPLLHLQNVPPKKAWQLSSRAEVQQRLQPLKSRCSSHPCFEQQQQNCLYTKAREPKPSAENSFFQNCRGTRPCSLCCFLDLPPPCT